MKKRSKDAEWWRADAMNTINHTKAVCDIRDAAEQGNAEAQCALARIYQLGDEIPQDHAEAQRWYRMAAEYGNADAQSELGWYLKQESDKYKYSDGTPEASTNAERLLAEAKFWLSKAAAQGHKGALDTLDYIKTQEEGWLPPYRQRAEDGDADMQFILGVVLQLGLCTQRDVQEARYWFGKAAGQGHKEAQYALDFKDEKGDWAFHYLQRTNEDDVFKFIIIIMKGCLLSEKEGEKSTNAIKFFRNIVKPEQGELK